MYINRNRQGQGTGTETEGPRYDMEIDRAKVQKKSGLRYMNETDRAKVQALTQVEPRYKHRNR